MRFYAAVNVFFRVGKTKFERIGLGRHERTRVGEEGGIP